MEKTPVVSKAIIIPFILITICFPLWGFANDITNPMVSSFRTILVMDNWQSALIQMAFYGGYFAMAIPAALFIKRLSYKSGIMMGLGLYAIGAFIFIPASYIGAFSIFLIAYFILTCGLSFLETSANPYILSMGTIETSTRRLNFSQAFNPLGSLIGMFTAKEFILDQLHKEDYKTREILQSANPAQFEMLKTEDLAIIRNPYVAIGLLILIFLFIMVFVKMPKFEKDHTIHFKHSVKRLIRNKRYSQGVIAQFFYVGAQILCWTFIIQYGESMGLTKAQAQGYNIIAMVLFVFSRFIATYMMKFFKPGNLLLVFGIGGVIFTAGATLIPGMTGLYSLIGISACMSLMFPTIYGIALEGVGEDKEIGAAGLIMAILGGSVLPPLQALIIDAGGPGYNDITFMGISETRLSFIMPLICLAIVARYGFNTIRKYSLSS